MKVLRSIDGIYRGPSKHWVGDGFLVRNYFPRLKHLVPKVSPFFFLDYHEPYAYPPTENTRRGVGPHPHRGLETVTIALAGAIAHHDSAGNGGVIHPDEVQWMTAGAGLLHREYHEAAFARAGGLLHMLQLWVNLPKVHKMTEPKYQALTVNMIPEVDLGDHGGKVRVIAGEYGRVRGPAETFTPMALFDIRLNPGGMAQFPLPASFNASLLIHQGQARVNQLKDAEASDLVVFERDGEGFSVQALGEPVGAILMAGEPIDEPIAAGGPFLMNEPAEIHQAFADYEAGKFGKLDD
jgi:redox-sensitive bicupin YhaK (pirin superfamily)